MKHINLFEQFVTEKKSSYQVYHRSYTSAIDTALEYAESQGYTYKKVIQILVYSMGDKYELNTYIA